ncbi:MAG TPA: hypothetical protein VIL48_06320 [Acidimicrobiales bacterium]
MRTRTLLATVSLAGTLTMGLVTGLGSPASAQDDPGAQSPRAGVRSSQEVPVVHDAGLDAAPTQDSAANLAACYDGAKGWDAGTQDADGDAAYIPGADDGPDGRVGRVPVYLASSRCNDVNLRVTGGWTNDLAARVCFFPTSGPYSCNQWTSIPVGDADWHVIATNVRDGSRFEIQFRSPGTHPVGSVAY